MPSAQGLGGDQVEGRQSVRELLRADRRPVRSLLMSEGMDAAAVLDEIEKLAARRRVRIEYVSRRRLDSVARTDAAQGVVALARPVEETPLESLCGSSHRGRVPFLLVLDGITDPHNLGALLRSAECAGVTGIVLPRHRSAHLSPTAAKAAAGAIEYLPMALVAGVPAALRQLSEAGVWTVGLAGGAGLALYDLALGDQPVALVLGSEGAGLAALTRKRCDALASIPQHGSLSSLNVSTAGAIACFDVARQRAK
ncbi:MAG TPA: 23S rRNA (guanosine(2251)-2'-O)-methyltransferase RlmB [Acidimicrobiales bacterium]|nr:23S rRNA (guanosine(2251)-2'-O)-methyltransferase RlmB [Acidimicrobiales bacterium]